MRVLRAIARFAVWLWKLEWRPRGNRVHALSFGGIGALWISYGAVLASDEMDGAAIVFVVGGTYFVARGVYRWTTSPPLRQTIPAAWRRLNSEVAPTPPPAPLDPRDS